MATATSSVPILNGRFDSDGFRPHFGARAAAAVGSKVMAQLPKDSEPKDELRSLARTGHASSLLRLLSLQWVRNGKYHVDELAKDQRGNTLLMLASQAGHHETVTVLLQLGASLWATSKSAKSVIFSRPASNMVDGSGAETKGSPRRGSGSLTELRYGGMTALHYGAWSGSMKTVSALCETGQAIPIGLLSADGCSPLHCAITGFSARKADCLTKNHSSNICQELTVAPLVQQLIGYGADIDTPCGARRRWCSLLGRPCRHLQSRISRGLTPLHCAVDAGDTLSVTMLLAAGCDVSARTSWLGLCDKNQTALHFACEQLQVDVVRMLLDAGASPRVTDHYGATPMHLVFSNAADLSLNSFGMCGAVYDVETLDRNEQENIASARTQIVHMLLEAGVDRFATARHPPTDDPAAGRSTIQDDNLTVANMASTQLGSGGAEVLRLLGTCFTQPQSLKNSCRLAVRRCLKRPITNLGEMLSDVQLAAFLLFKEK